MREPSAAEPTIADVRAAHARIADHIHRTPVMTSRTLDALAGVRVFLKCETFQRGGAFKARGALNAVLSLTGAEAAHGVATHSSGNHAAALALAASIRGVPCHVVMPTGAPLAKVDAVRAYKGRIIDCEPSFEAREQKLAEVLAETGAHEVHPFDDPRVIAGAGTACLELLEEHPAIGLVIAPVSGGGLLSGTAIAAHGVNAACRVWGAEPADADDAFRSLQAGRLVRASAPSSIADALLAQLSERTLRILSHHVEGIVRVDDTDIVHAMRLLFGRCKLVVEPGGATGLAGLLALAGLQPHRSTVQPRAPLPEHVGVILSGANVDLERLPFSAAP